ncbi:Triacylglycerol lipase [Bertholletia excelsa]
MLPNSWRCFSSSSTVLIFSLLLVSFGVTQAVIRLPPNVTVPAVFVFGDSIVDPGNNNNNLKTIARANHPPYGKDFMGGKPTGRFSNGRVPSDFIAEELGIKELLPAYLDPSLQTEDLTTGVNFASGAAGYDPLTSEISNVISLPDQLDLFKEYTAKLKGLVGGERTSTILINSIFVVVAGSNDLTNTYFTLRSAQYDVSTYVDLIISLASDFVQELYGLGARRIAVFGSPPGGCTPARRTLSGGPQRNCAEIFNQAAELFNTRLSEKLSSLNSNFPDAKMVYIDIYTLTMDIILNPQKYGYEVTDRGCCGTGLIEVVMLCEVSSFTCPNRSKYVFWDSYHPTERVYQLLVQSLVKANINKLL